MTFVVSSTISLRSGSSVTLLMHSSFGVSMWTYSTGTSPSDFLSDSSALVVTTQVFSTRDRWRALSMIRLLIS